MVLIYHILAPYKKPATLAIDGILTALLFATFVVGAVRAGNGTGACTGPAKQGKWINHRGCQRMIIATGFTAATFATFAASTILAVFR